MSDFGKFYLDKEKDMVVCLDMEEGELSYRIFALNHRSDNLINNLAIKHQIRYPLYYIKN